MNIKLVTHLSIKPILVLITLFLCVFGFTQRIYSTEISISAANTTDQNVEDAVLLISNADFLSMLKHDSGYFLEILCNQKILSYQFVDNDANGVVEELLVLCDFKPNEIKKITFSIKKGMGQKFPKRTQAELSVKEGGEWIKVIKDSGKEQYEYSEGVFKNIDYLRVPENHTDHSYFVRYEGPGWESDKVAYRFYLDWRNAIDLFGKKIPDMILQNVGLDGFDSYHAESNWGMDVLKVGNSLGLGSFGFWNGKNAIRVANTDSITCRIGENGVIRSKILTSYFGWTDAGKTINLVSEISILAGSRLSKIKLRGSDSIPNFCTGIVKLGEESPIIFDSVGSEWAYFATFGKHSLNNDSLGMVIFYKKQDLIMLTSDPLSHVIVLRPENNEVAYYLGAVWEKDLDGIKSREEFIIYLDKTLKQLNSPIKIIFPE